jgi:Ca-activated chloride channel homolog
MRSLLAITFLLLFVVGARAQDDTIRVETNLVTLNVSVTNNKGDHVRGLTKSDFQVLDNGQRQDIDSFSTENAPVSFGIVYDLHPATDEQTKSVLEALRTFTASLGPDDDYFVTVFNEKGSLTTDFVPNAEQIDGQATGGANSLYDALFAASNRMSRSRNQKRVMLVLTDGADHSSHHSQKELRTHLRSVNLPVYSITFGRADRNQYGYSDIFLNGQQKTFGIRETAELDRGIIGEISKSSGGQTFESSIRNRVYVSALLSKVFDEIKGQYVIGFYPDRADGRYHKLKVTVNGQKQKKLRISNRKGYQSPRAA